MRMNIEGLTFSYDEKNTVNNANITVKKGEFVGLIGPNGSGKSTLLKNIYKALVPDNGSMTLDGENLLKMNYKQAAQKLAVVGQENEVPFDFSVEEIVSMGRSPHKKLFDIDTEQDRYMVHHALEHLGMENMAKRNFQKLSGGEKQRVLLARTVAQECDFLILDEPTNHLDINYQIQMFDFIKRLRVTVLSAMHDLNIAALYCDRLYAMKGGNIILSGTPEDVLTEENIQNLFGVKCSVTKHCITKKPIITYLPLWIKEDRQ